MKRVEREWMYERVDDRKMVKYEYVVGVNSFIEYVKTQDEFSHSQLIRCPCVKCKNMKYLSEFVVHEHLIRKGFTGNYYEWVCHGEPFSFPIPNNEPNTHASIGGSYRDMVIDGLGDTALDLLEEPPIGEEETPHPQLKSFFDMLEAAEMPLYKGSDMSVLQATSRLINIKCEDNLSHKCVDKVASLLEDALPRDNVMTRTFYNAKKLLKALQLPYQKIHCCEEGCMLFWNEDVSLEKCKKCGKDRYKPKPASGKSIPHKFLIYLPLGPRLQRLYATRNIAEAIRWHDQNPRVQGTFAHPSDSEAWKHLDKMFPLCQRASKC
ncbi:uncharacterized protein LOC141630256 [Silene latifolia]|uniref:uncharacterized protein LOC141630256 n=1 Tax=Silene latifolia TaxID=37657 RepID=UPI003D77B62E